MKHVHVSRHALEQYLARWPNQFGTPFEVIAREVLDALENHRYSTKEPKWAQKNPRRRSVGFRNGSRERDRSLRYVWTEDRKRVYLVDKSGGVSYVVTAISPQESDSL